MERAALDQFLDTGWMNGAELFYHGCIYRTECCKSGNKYLAFAYSWRARKISSDEYIDDFTPEEKEHWCKVFERTASTEEGAREALLNEPIFEGKTFWEAEREIEWLEHA